MTTEGKPIQCKAAVAYKPKEQLKIETITVLPPGPGEVRVKIVATGICHTDLSMIQGNLTPFNHLFPLVPGHEGAGIVESVGSGVTKVVPGDHVIIYLLHRCGDCELCAIPNNQRVDGSIINQC